MKIKNVILIVLILLLMFISGIGWFIYFQNEKRIEKKEEYSFEWCSNYIWDDLSENNTWMCFRKKINIQNEEDLDEIIAQIAVDSKYWLYINGEMIVREGALKRGETRNSIYYDQLDITEYLNVGENTIAVLVWYWGDTSYSHNSSGQGAFLFQTRIGGEYIVSDDSWKVLRNPAYLQDPLRPNKRLIEYNVYYDANLEIDDWYIPEYDDSSWEYASILAPVGNPAWGELIERNIPQFKNSEEIIEYINMDEYRYYITKEDDKLEMNLQYNAQFTPYFKIDAPEAGMKITIKTDMYADINGDSVMCTYFTKKGEQEFESLAWMNGENVYYELPEGIKIISLGYRETGFDSEMTGLFTSDDDFFNKLWQMSSRTLYVNMRDSYMDCPNRERAQWTGDMNVSMLQAMYALDTNANALYEKGVKTILGWNVNGNLLTVAPIVGDYLHLPAQSLAGVYSIYGYYKYTGNKEFIEYTYPYAKNYLDLWVRNEVTGLLTKTEPYYEWEWGDSVANSDYKAIEMAWYYLALDGLGNMANVLGYEDDYIEITDKLNLIKEDFNKLWTKKGYKTSNVRKVDERVNSLAVIAGIAEEEKYEVIKDILIDNYQTTPYMELYSLEALCKMGYINEAQNRIKDRYDEMVNGRYACSTLWEHWSPTSGTKNHAWAGGPLIIMSKYFAGIEPLEEGYESVLVKPQFGELKNISANVTTVKGDIKLFAEKNEMGVDLNVFIPVDAKIAIEKMSSGGRILVNGTLIYEDGIKRKLENIVYDSEDESFVYFNVKNGEYEFRSE